MPHHFLPRKSGAHRIACVSLYRALLAQCPRIVPPPELPSQGATNPIKHLIRKGFRRYVNCTSPKILVEVLKSGYEAEELLRAAGDGDQSSLSTIHTHLWALHQQRVTARATCLPPHQRSQNTAPRVWPYPGAARLLDTHPVPKEQLTGKRGRPKLAAANGVPFLRVKKPQSEFLGRVLRDKAAQKQRRFDRLREMDEAGDAGKAEEEWGRLIEETFREEGALAMERGDEKRETQLTGWMRSDEGKSLQEDWSSDVEFVRGKAYGVMMREQRKWLEMGKRMAAVADQAQALWEKEQEERKGRRFEHRMKRNLGTDGSWEEDQSLSQNQEKMKAESPRSDQTLSRPL